MKASTVRRLTEVFELDVLEGAVEALVEREEDLLGVDGEGAGEKLTHVMLAIRVKRRVVLGEDPKEAFRAEMAAVREVLRND